MIILEQLPQCQKVEWYGILRFILQLLEIPVSILVPAPVHDRTMDGTHEKVNRQ